VTNASRFSAARFRHALGDAVHQTFGALSPTPG